MEKKDDVHQPASKCRMFHTSSYYLRKGGYATASVYLFIPPSICLLGRGRRLCGCFFKYSYDWAGKALIASFLTSMLPTSSFPSCFILTCSILAARWSEMSAAKTGRSFSLHPPVHVSAPRTHLLRAERCQLLICSVTWQPAELTVNEDWQWFISGPSRMCCSSFSSPRATEEPPICPPLLMNTYWLPCEWRGGNTIQSIILIKPNPVMRVDACLHSCQ